MRSKYTIILITCGMLICSIASCSKDRKQVEEVLTFSKENRLELERVLEYYKDSSMKLKAAEFLISNMVGLSIPDTLSLAEYRPFYHTCDSVSQKYRVPKWQRWVALIDSLWDIYKVKKALQPIKYIPLLNTITAKQLIAEIDLAFDAWQNNVYTKNCSFEDFCEYILPFYRGNSFVIDDERSRFHQLHKGCFYKNNKKTVLIETDSVLSLYKNIVYCTFNESDIIVLSAKAFTQIGGGKCTERVIFNSLLLSSLGMPVAVDFVPAWGNTEFAHSWNTLVIKGKHFAFDAYWNKDNWVYNNLYANKEAYDPNGYGILRAAKVYRKTYSTHLENTLLNRGINMEDIPPLFLNFKMRDVSSDYFETVDIEVTLTETSPRDAHFAYLCTFGSKELNIVQYGEIANSRVLFRGMGKNIIYFPVYYKNGVKQVAADPFWLTQEGKIQQLTASGDTDDVVVISGVCPECSSNWGYLNCMVGTRITGHSLKGTVETLCSISSNLPERHTTYKLTSPSAYRFLQLNLPSDSIALGDLSFYSPEGKIPNIRITSTLYPLEKDCSQNLLFDEFKTTCYRGKAQNRVVDIDLGREYTLTEIELSPYTKSFLYENSTYELLYWENGWKSLGEQKGGVKYLTFENAPRNVLFRLKQSTKVDRKIRERIFMYKDGEVIWM